MNTDGGGWTLVWAYNFTKFEDFLSPQNAISPWVTIPTQTLAQVRVSTIPPSHPHDYNALDYIQWKDIGQDFMSTSNINHWISCTPGSGSLVLQTTGIINCQNVKNVSPLCLGNAPNTIFFSGTAFVTFIDSSSKIFTSLKGVKHLHAPYGDPCGSGVAPDLTNVTGPPHGNMYIR